MLHLLLITFTKEVLFYDCCLLQGLCKYCSLELDENKSEMNFGTN